MISDTLLTQLQVQTLARSVGWNDNGAKIIAAICMVESAASINGRSYADSEKVGDQSLANTIWGYSYGLAQIRSLRSDKGTGKPRDADKLPDPTFNLKTALTIFKNNDGGSFSDWTTYNNGQYKAYLPKEFPPPAGVHIVKSGDTLIRIQQKYPDPAFVWKMLAKVNGLRSPYTIYINQPLQLPVWKFTVRAGDTLTSIHAAYSKVTMKQLIDYNKKFRVFDDENNLEVGDVILIPHPYVLQPL